MALESIEAEALVHGRYAIGGSFFAGHIGLSFYRNRIPERAYL
jgi:hypothetical protein